ncbi:MAG TPA: DAK2 domain-containing protein [Pseudonocardiaceae bacterium]|nr:DAK2 domain-containing protein [Pseudonocardiaceae bacterium]
MNQVPHVVDVVDGPTVRRWVDACVRTLDEHREEIDRINVFPVADRDTGTNLLRTMQAVLDAVSRDLGRPDEPAEVWAVVATGALAGARGNSGVILSQVLRGLGEVLGSQPANLADALTRADELAAKAVSDPAPGTMLTVLHTAALAAARHGGSPAEIASTAARAATEALAGTSGQLDVLARAGVVDAGAQGLVLVLDELAVVLTGDEHNAGLTVAPARRTPREPDLLRTAREAGSTEYAYEVMYALDRVDDPAADVLRVSLRGLGDCVSVVGDGGGRWAVHVHCNDIGAAVEAGIEIGRPHRITVVRFDDQVAEASSRFARDRAVVVLARGTGVAELFRAERAVVLVLPELGPPDPAELVAVLAGTQAEHVTVLPNEPDLEAVLDAAAAEAVQAGQDVLIVPTASPVQGLAALAVHDPARRPGEDVVAMAEAAAATRRGELTLAAEEAITWVGRCQPDDVLGLLDGEVVLIEAGPASATAVMAGAVRLLDRMLSSGGELVTVLVGAGAPAGIAEELAEHVRTEHREVEFVGYDGGQAEPILLLGVE